MLVQPQNERVTLQKRLNERAKSVANRLLSDLNLPRAGRQIGRVMLDARGKNNNQALIILMAIEVNNSMGISDGQRKEVTSEKLRNAYNQLDSLGDNLVQKIREALRLKGEKQ